MNSIGTTANRPRTARPTVRLREDWDRHVSSDEDEHPLTPVSDSQDQPHVKQKSETRAWPEGKPAGHRHRMSKPKSSNQFLSELESLYENMAAEMEPPNEPRTYSARSAKPLAQRVLDNRTRNDDFAHRAPQQILTHFCSGFFTRIMTWTLTLLGTILTLLQFPIAAMLTLVIAYWGAGVAYGSLPFAGINLCEYTPISSLEYCQKPPPGPAYLPPRVKEGLDYTSKLEEMQTLGAHSADLPYLLTMGEGGVRGMIVQLSVVDLPTRNKLMPLLQDYRDTVDRTIDGLSDWLSNIDRVVDFTILVNTWAESQLERIEARDSSLMTPLNNMVNRAFGLSLGFHTTEKEVRGEFFALTEKVGVQVSKVVVEAQRHYGQLNELKAILDSIALAVLEDKRLLKKEKLSQKSYWKWLLRDYRDKMTEFDAKMEMCARFYHHTEQALLVLSTTQIKITQMKSQLKSLRDGLNDAPLLLDSGKPASLRLYIDALKGGVESLEATKKTTRALKAEKMRQIDEAIKL